MPRLPQPTTIPKTCGGCANDVHMFDVPIATLIGRRTMARHIQLKIRAGLPRRIERVCPSCQQRDTWVLDETKTMTIDYAVEQAE